MNFECLVDLPIVYDGLTNVNSTRFEYIGNLSQIIPLQHKKNNKINLFLLIEKQKCDLEGSLDIPASYITIRPFIKVHSDVNESVILSAKFKNGNKLQEYKNRCNKGDNIILGSNEKGLFDVYIEGYQNCNDFCIFDLGSSVIRLNRKTSSIEFLLIKLVVKKEENCYCCYISYPTLSSDISIENKLSISIYAHQTFQQQIDDFTYHPMIIPPYDKIIYAKEQPFLSGELTNKYNCIVSFSSNSRGHLLSYDETCHSKRINDTNFFYDVENIDRDNKKIVIYESSKSVDDKNINNNNNNQQPKMNFNLLLTEIQASFIDSEMHELFLIELSKVSLNIDDKIDFSIEGFAINDMYSASLSPVVLHGKETPFLNVKILSKYPLKTLMFEDISIKLAPIQLYIDFQFIGDFIALMKEISGYFKQFKFDYNFLFNIFSTKKFSINNICANLTPNCLLYRKYRFSHKDDFYFSYFKIPFSRVLTIDFQEINMYNVEAPIINFFQTIPYFYMNQFTFSKGVAMFANFIFTTPKESKLFDYFLQNKTKVCFDSILEIPRRIPRAFLNGRIDDIISYTSDKYPNKPTTLQFEFQRFGPLNIVMSNLKNYIMMKRNRNG
ncbi:hypothetical protein M9Y10_023874 [Tritrichomonas musculus]|uniref:Uncharacterized protein n=1 Tax=Tritrichomonas musculus TaxID=1915356 RepID=A0ABR2KWD1_9EUKA